MIVEAAGARLFVRDRSTGSPIVMLHGFPQTRRCWDRIADDLAATIA